MKLHRWEDIRAEAAKEPGFEEAYEQAGRELVAEIVEYHLAELRQLRELTQVELARQLGISQPGLSAIERRGDVQLSTLRDYVEGLGGRLELTAVFDDGDVRLPLVLDSGTGARPAVRTEADVAEDKPVKRTRSRSVIGHNTTTTVSVPAPRRKPSAKLAPSALDLSEEGYREFLRLGEHHPDMTQVEICRHFGISQAQLSRARQRALREGYAALRGRRWGLTPAGREYLDTPGLSGKTGAKTTRLAMAAASTPRAAQRARGRA